MSDKKDQKKNQGTDMEATAQVFGSVFKSIFGDDASVMMVDLVPQSESGKKNPKETSAPLKPGFSRAKMVRAHIMEDMLVADFCEELSNDMISLACMVELMENIFTEMTAGKLSERKAQQLVIEILRLKSEITEKWDTFYAEGT